MTTPISDDGLKEAMKSALVEVLNENSDLIKQIIEDVIEDIGLSRAIDEGLDTPPVDRSVIANLLGGAL
jgi:hypothetical protein